MQAAEELFAASGYTAVSMSDIAQRCEMSKKTLYELFTSKEELLTGLIADVEAFPLSACEEDDADPAKALRATLTAIAHFVLSERHINVSRLVISEIRRRAGNGEALLRTGHAARKEDGGGAPEAIGAAGFDCPG